MLQEIEGTLLARLWPHDQVVIGMRVSRWVRAQLQSQADRVQFRTRSGNETVSQIDVTKAMTQFQHPSVQFEVIVHSCPALCAPLLDSLKVAWRTALGSRLVQLEIVDAMQWSTRTGEIMEEIPIRCSSLTTLRLNGLRVQPDSFVRFVGNLSCCSALSKLNLQRCGLGIGNSLALAKSLTSLSALKTLNLADNGITDVFETLFHLKMCPSLCNLDLSSNYFNISTFTFFLEEPTGLRQLTLQDADMRDGCCKFLGPRLQNCKLLEHLDVSRNKMQDDGCTALVQGLEHCHRLCYLDMSHNSISTAKALELYQAIRAMRCMVVAKLGGAREQLGHARAQHEHARGCPAVAKLQHRSERPGGGQPAAAWQDALAFLQLQANMAQVEPCAQLAMALPRASLTHLDLSGNLMGDPGAKLLSAALPSCARLACLLLDRNRLGQQGMQALCAGLQRCCELTTLALGNNYTTARGAAPLASLLPSLRRLATLNLRDNELGAGGAEVLARGLEGCRALTALDLQHNQLRDAGAALLALPLARCTMLRSLTLSENQVGAQGVQRLADALRLLRGLQVLDLACNQMGADGAAAVCGMARQGARLRELNVLSNAIPEQHQARMAAVFGPRVKIRF